MNEKNNEKNLVIPISIIIAGVLIALSIFLAFNKDTNNSKENQNKDNQAQIEGAKETKKTETALSPESITKEDYIFGNPDAEVFVVTYTDVECPYCKKLHKTMLNRLNEA